MITFSRVHHTLPPNRLAAIHKGPKLRKKPEPVKNISSSSSSDSIEKQFIKYQQWEQENNPLSIKGRAKKYTRVRCKTTNQSSRKVAKKEKLDNNSDNSSNIADDSFFNEVPEIKNKEINPAANFRKANNEPTLGISVVGRSVVGTSVSHVRPQKISLFEEKMRVNPSLPVSWSRLGANPVKRPKPPPLMLTNEQMMLKKMMSKEELSSAARELSNLETIRKERKANQLIPDWAKTTSMMGPPKATSKAKCRVISKSMVSNDF